MFREKKNSKTNFFFGIIIIIIINVYSLKHRAFINEKIITASPLLSNSGNQTKINTGTDQELSIYTS